MTLKDIHEAVPKHLLKCEPFSLIATQPNVNCGSFRPTGSPFKATMYILRDITFTLFLFKFAASIGPWAQSDFGGYVTDGWQKTVLKSSLWLTYYWFQGMVWAGIFCLGKRLPCLAFITTDN